MKKLPEIVAPDILDATLKALSNYGCGVPNGQQDAYSIITHITQCAQLIKQDAASELRINVLKRYKDDLIMFKDVKDALQIAIDEETQQGEQLRADIAAIEI